jgi:hypothetical protein
MTRLVVIGAAGIIAAVGVLAWLRNGPDASQFAHLDAATQSQGL